MRTGLFRGSWWELVEDVEAGIMRVQVAILVILVNLGVDLTYGFLNPRIRR